MSESQFLPMLPVAVVDRIFARMQLAYGATWVRMWEGTNAAKLKVEWQRRLAWVKDPAPIAYALDNLPEDWPPNSMQFSALCRSMPRPEPVAAIEHHIPAEPERVRALIGAMKVGGAPVPAYERLAARAQAGEKLGYYQRQVLKAALGRAVRCSPTPDLFAEGQHAQ